MVVLVIETVNTETHQRDLGLFIVFDTLNTESIIYIGMLVVIDSRFIVKRYNRDKKISPC